mgnify:FL=1
MKNNIMDWLLAQMRLVDVEDEEEEAEQDVKPTEKIWPELIHRKRNMMSEKDGQVFFKIIQSYADCKLVIDNYKTGVVCIYSLASMESSGAREMMNYISGGVYALDGDISTVGENVFMARPALQVCSR